MPLLQPHWCIGELQGGQPRTRRTTTNTATKTPGGPRDPVTDSVGDGAPPSLHLIYQTMMAQHKQIQGDNKKARLATKQLQVAVSKVAKSCSEIGERIATTETRTSVLEAELGTVVQQSTMHESQLTDIQWKLEDFENQQRHNNLCILGTQEGAEGQDTGAFIVKKI
ncbi:hypothetical protein NDU88_005914 [Pleurodeles waltl]|uniref:Uncharacterized protein n=1 Tax=Pleurodeles waltl TaxID=8319 RepID=A0AAV7RNN1_PLEWA|nr:hypothetical protein NDU88_005914 [Pleurodeles waltl]